MEFQKITNFLDISSDNRDLPKFVTKTWIEVYDQLQGNYDVNKEIRIKTSMFRSNLCDYSNAYIIVKGDITVTNPNDTKRNKAVALKNNAPFINCISKINGVKIDNTEDLDVVMPMYNLLEYNLPMYDLIKLVKMKKEVVIPLKYLSNFWRSLNIPLINCEVEIILTWTKNCVLADMTVANNPPTRLEFQIKDTKLYVPVVTLSKENDIKLLEQLKSGFKKTIKWNKYRSQMTM